jgi:succinate dehydrogenase/fumarate reductase flavoprotein subunit
MDALTTLNQKKDVSRRGFIQGAASTAAVGIMTWGLAGCQQASGAPGTGVANEPETWDREVDVVVIGYGGAGAAAAITAHDEGAEVLILEKMPEGGGNTCIGGGGFLCPTDANKSNTYIKALFDYSLSNMDEECVRVFSDEAMKNADWLKSLMPGVEVRVYGGAGFPQVEGADSQDKYQVIASDGTSGAAALFSIYAYATEEDRGIEVLLETPAKELIQNAANEVIGVLATSAGKDIRIKAKRGVVLATGGYENDPTILNDHVKGAPIYSLAWSGNTGDGVRMAQKAGAALWHMNATSCPLGFKAPEYATAFMWSVPGPSFIWVDRNAERFIDENEVETHAGLLAVDFYSSKELRYPRIPCYAIFDESARANKRAMNTMGMTGRSYQWSADNLAEIDKGWIKKADTIEALATQIGLDPAALVKTVAKWNEDINEGHDTLFERHLESAPSTAYLDQSATIKSAPLVAPPFYAIELHPTLTHTLGGPRRNAKAQILDALGTPIPRLYSSGELGCMWGIIYQGAGNNAESMTSGRTAGRNVVAETPWDA